MKSSTLIKACALALSLIASQRDGRRFRNRKRPNWVPP